VAAKNVVGYVSSAPPPAYAQLVASHGDHPQTSWVGQTCKNDLDMEDGPETAINRRLSTSV